MNDLLSDFALEAADSLGGLQGGLATLSLRREDRTAAAEMRRRLHGLKGLCSFVGMVRAEAVAHAAESLLHTAGPGQPPSFSDLALLGDAVHRIAELIAFVAYDGVEPRGDDSALIDALETAAAAAGPRVTEPVPLFVGEAPAPAIASERRARPPWCGLDNLARGLGDRLGKRIDLAVGGDNLRIDIAAAAPLRAALIALVRNACDHGVETPSERRNLGKAPAALLQLTLRRTSDGLAVDLVDDGRGIEPGTLRRRCVAIGAIGASEAEALSDEEAQRLVFTPGLTTAATLTVLSGRGVGLEVVRREVEGLGGQVELSSVPGKGARFTLLLPRSVLAEPGARRLAAA
jgi:chemotaxis protein histidine kinase CheA